ncbi:hypothetical protein Hanom_Chr15g01391201 [Helianthus anomalus]
MVTYIPHDPSDFFLGFDTKGMRCYYLAHEVNLYFLNVVKYMGKPSVAFFPKIALCDRILLTIFSKKTQPLAFFAQSRNNDGLMPVQNS